VPIQLEIAFWLRGFHAIRWKYHLVRVRGRVLALIWLFGALLFALSIVGLPLTRAAIEMAKLSAFPFGKEVVHVRELDGKGITTGTAVTGTIGFIVNVIWACTFGIALFFGHLVAGVINCLFIITIPFGIQSFKLAGLSFWPVGRRVVSIEMARIAREHNAQDKFNKIRAKSGNGTVVVAT
jgi:uncharacterized membrane protein YccF (DUF307 family)